MISSWLISLGLTRDSWVWFYSRITSGALLLVSGIVPLDQYVGPRWAKVITVASVVILWFAGKYDSSPLPGKKQ